MKVKFQADADLHEELVWAVRRTEPSIDFQTANEANLHGLDDLTVLALAASENRILISHDRKTMPHHFAQFIQTQTSFGVFIISQKFNFAETIDDIVLIWSATESEEWINVISELPLVTKAK